MHRMIIATAAAAVLSVAGAAHAGGYGEYSGGYSGGYSYSPCGCQGYEDSGERGYGYGNRYVDEDDLYSYGYESYDYIPFESSTYGYRYDDVYGRGGYDYGGSGYAIPRYRSYSHSYDYDRGYHAPRSYGYRSYHYSTPHYSSRRYRSYRSYGHSSTDGERG